MPLKSMTSIRGLTPLDSPTSTSGSIPDMKTPATSPPELDNGLESPIDKDLLYNQETLRYMKVIDNYKNLGIGKQIKLPRLVIEGTQSCGNSNLLEDIRSKLPRFNAETREMLFKKRTQLQALGPPRSTVEDQRKYLKTIVAAYQSPKNRCLIDDMRSARNDSDSTLLLRALGKAEMSLLHAPLKNAGATWKFLSPKPELDLESDNAADEYLSVASDDSKGIYSWIAERYHDSQSRSLPGLVPPALVERLFEEQTVSWRSITDTFLISVGLLFRKSVMYCLETSCENNNVLTALKQLVTRELETRMAKLKDLCRDLAFDEQDGLHLIARKEQFVKEVQEARTLRFISALARLEHEARLNRTPTTPIPLYGKPASPELDFAGFGMPRNASVPPVTPPSSTAKKTGLFSTPPSPPQEQTFQTVMSFTTTNKDKFKEVINADRQIVYEIHDILKAYYSISLEHYIDAVCRNGLNGSFIDDIMNIFSDNLVDSMSEKSIAEVAAETAEDLKTRKELIDDIERLDKAIADSEAILKSPLI